jgi:hypothetical protein
MASYSETLSANAKKRWIGGLSFVLMEVTGPVNITFYGRNNKILETIENVLEGVEGYWPNGFAGVEIEDVSGASNTVKLMVSNLAQWKYSRFKADVTVDGEIEGITDPVNIQPETAGQFLADPLYQALNRSFFGVGIQKGGASSKRSWIELANPAASGKTVAIRRVSGHSSWLIWGIANQAFNAAAIDVTPTPAPLNGTGTSVCTVSAGVSGTYNDIDKVLGEVNMGNGNLLKHPMEPDIIIAEGEWFSVIVDSNDTALGLSMVWEEY